MSDFEFYFDKITAETLKGADVILIENFTMFCNGITVTKSTWNRFLKIGPQFQKRICGKYNIKKFVYKWAENQWDGLTYLLTVGVYI